VNNSQSLFFGGKLMHSKQTIELFESLQMKLSCAHISYLIYCKYLLSSLKYYHQIAVNNKFTLVRSLRVSKVSSLIGTGSMFQIAFTVLNNRRVSKFSDKCLWRLDITTDSFVSINLHPTGSDSFPAQFAEFWWRNYPRNIWLVLPAWYLSKQ